MVGLRDVPEQRSEDSSACPAWRSRFGVRRRSGEARELRPRRDCGGTRSRLPPCAAPLNFQDASFKRPPSHPTVASHLGSPDPGTSRATPRARLRKRSSAAPSQLGRPPWRRWVRAPLVLLAPLGASLVGRSSVARVPLGRRPRAARVLWWATSVFAAVVQHRRDPVAQTGRPAIEAASKPAPPNYPEPVPGLGRGRSKMRRSRPDLVEPATTAKFR